MTAPAAQQPSWARQVTFALRISRGDLSAVTDTVAREMAAIDPALALANRQTMNEVVDRSLGWPRLLSVLASVFAVLAALLAAIGTYGLIAYAVGQRTWEFGVRMAMGADRAAVMRLVLAQGMTLAVAGIVLGGIAAVSLARMMRSLLYEVTPGHPWVLGATCAVVLASAVAACYVPARAAARVDPIVALRAS